jgi:hypothetical protein
MDEANNKRSQQGLKVFMLFSVMENHLWSFCFNNVGPPFSRALSSAPGMDTRGPCLIGATAVSVASVVFRFLNLTSRTSLESPLKWSAVYLLKNSRSHIWQLKRHGVAKCSVVSGIPRPRTQLSLEELVTLSVV